MLRPSQTAIGLLIIILYAAIVTAVDRSIALSLFGNIVLAASAALTPIVVWSRRRQWSGCQRLFWNTLAVGMALWVIGHVGWAYHDLVLQNRPWLQWHTVFSLCGGIAPVIALLTRPHRGCRPHAVTTVAIDLATYGLLAVFVYAYFVLVPSLVPTAPGDTQAKLLYLVQLNRLVLLTGLVVALGFAWRTEWRSTYARLATGVAIGFMLRIGTSLAIVRGEYHSGSLHDLAWITPWLFYAWAAAQAPASPQPEDTVQHHVDQPPVAMSAIPVLLIPAIGYGVLYVESMGAPVDSFRALLTGLTTVCGLGLLTLRLATQTGELHRADARLRLLAAATEQTGDLILITSADGTFEHANEAFLRALGYSRREMASVGLSYLMDPAAIPPPPNISMEVAECGVWRGTLVRRRKDGSTFPAACTVVALKDSSGRITHFVGVERDITDEIRLRDQLIHSERLSAIGELVAGVAHEINNPLQTIVGCVELMMEDRPGAINHRDLDTVRREAARAGQIVRNLLSFVRRGVRDRGTEDLNQLVRSTVELREYHLRQQNIAVEARYAPTPLYVLASRDEIQQVILNLLLNAEHAIASSSGSGTIRIVTSTEDNYHAVEVADTGPGIRPDLRGRIFEPFFTTKQVGEGTGLGLSISHGIASAHGGSLELHESASGARFRLILPVHAGVRPAEHAYGTGQSVVSRRALVVDDEVHIRQLMIRLLQRRGFEVTAVETADAALSLAVDSGVGLIVCDVRMPGLSGPDLYRRLIAANLSPSPRFVFITGDTTSLELDPELAGALVLRKPFTAADLDAVLART